jgi:hypothetical protein
MYHWKDEEGNLVIWMPNVEKEAVMVDAQVDSFSQEGTGESHWANRCVLLPCFQTNRRPEVASQLVLERDDGTNWTKSSFDLDVVADALEGEELGKLSSKSYSYDESALPHELGTAQRKGPMHEAFLDWDWVPN